MEYREQIRRIKMLLWFIRGQGVHCIPWSLYDSLTPDYVTLTYNVEL